MVSLFFSKKMNLPFFVTFFAIFDGGIHHSLSRMLRLFCTLVRIILSFLFCLNTTFKRNGVYATYSVKMWHNPHAHKIYQIRIFTIMSPAKAKRTVKARYSKKRRIPSTIFTAPRFVIFVAGPVIINAAADPILIPS